MDQFYQVLRKVQKKERNNGTLARVEETFYTDIHEYLEKLKNDAVRDPFSNAHGILKEAQIIATEICERREHKITDAAVVNIQRSYQLFIGKQEFDLVDTTPLNLTPEEEKLYYSLIDNLKHHRSNISIEKLSEIEEKPLVKNNDSQKPLIKENTSQKPVEDLKPSKPKVKKEIKPKKEINIEKNPNAVNDEFYDFESKKIEKDTELVTMLVFKDVNSIVGVDEKIYGPFRPQDIVTLPLINAKVFFKNRLGRQVNI